MKIPDRREKMKTYIAHIMLAASLLVPAMFAQNQPAPEAKPANKLECSTEPAHGFAPMDRLAEQDDDSLDTLWSKQLRGSEILPSQIPT